MWILKAQLGKYSWHALCPVYNLILTRRWPYKNLWTMDYLLHCCECESWNQTKNRRERDRDEYISLLFLCLADCTMYVYVYGKCFFFFLPPNIYWGDILWYYSLLRECHGDWMHPLFVCTKNTFQSKKILEEACCIVIW